MAAPGYAEADLEAAVGRLAEGSRLKDAEAEIVAVAPALQGVLVEALASGGWFEDSHQSELGRASSIDDPDQRATAVATLLAEETRIAMMVGVAVGWALAGELGPPRQARPSDRAAEG